MFAEVIDKLGRMLRTGNTLRENVGLLILGDAVLLHLLLVCFIYIDLFYIYIENK
jgi:hypothetical protein